ncbi:4-hydroxythreonine-4-phosphate dehydrogenase PdxA [Thioclava sp. FR2]|uniref:4-hydroxythreonine-4-phosphate dehydrogenase PdxA n=1 Tax=Thioclava sp. FR2 TaxID=3445780 RepID=UPI003EBFB9F5
MSDVEKTARPAPLVMTCGEPAGIGPELAMKVRMALGSEVPFAWLGDQRHLPANTPVRVLDRLSDSASVPADCLPVLHHEFAGPATPGAPNPENAADVIEVIARAVKLTLDGEAGGIVTAPIHKKALKDGAAFAFPGHTEFLAHLAGDVPVAMMLASSQLRVVPATIHIPLRDVPDALSPEVLEQAIKITHAGLYDLFGIKAPRIAVAGLNPHAGEGGAMGLEDLTVIAPVIEKLRAKGFNVWGPLPADTMFHARARAGYDAAVCAYHDQALIPIKTLDFDGGVNVTLGLPFVRTSPDHGTALDIAGKGIALPDSTIAAMRMAWQMAQARLASKS